MSHTYSLKHKHQTLEDRENETHRFTFRYAGKQFSASIDKDQKISFPPEEENQIAKNVKKDIIENIHKIMNENNF